jgi:hypothetical protein
MTLEGVQLGWKCCAKTLGGKAGDGYCHRDGAFFVAYMRNTHLMSFMNGTLIFDIDPGSGEPLVNHSYAEAHASFPPPSITSP